MDYMDFERVCGDRGNRVIDGIGCPVAGYKGG